MKVAVLGATGMAGHTITLYLQEQGYDVTAISRKPFSLAPNIICEVENIPDLKKTMLNNNFDTVINCIGILNKNAEDNKAEAVFLNSYLPQYLAKILYSTPTRIIHMSTDCVFSGRTGSYSERSIPDGATYYDRTKALGEINDSKNLTFRNSIVGPDMQEQGIGLFNWFMKQDGTIGGYSKAVWTGVTTLTLAKAIEAAMQSNLTGLYNLVNNETISKLELLNLFNKYFKDEALNITKDDSVAINKSLINTRMDFLFKVPTYEIMIAEMKEWIDGHRKIYPHYFK